MKFGRYFIFITVISILFLPFITWAVKEDNVLNVTILDKSSEKEKDYSDSGLVWLLNHFKYVREDGNLHSTHGDYVREYPQKKENSDDIIYITDLSGGLKQQEFNIMKDQLSSGASLIVEYNTFASIRDKEIKDSLSNILGVSWSGWIGKYFLELSDSDNIPQWVRGNYEKQEKKKWNFTGAGFVFARENGEIIVLNGKDIGEGGSQFVLTNKGKEFLKTDIESEYKSWFEISTVSNKQTIVANFELDITDSGEKKLSEKGLSSTIPAVVRNHTDFYSSYYFSGDFATKAEIKPFRINGLPFLMSYVSRITDNSFFWEAYYPLMKGIFADALLVKNELNGKNEPDVMKEQGISYNVRTNNMDLQVFKDKKWKNVFVKGVNMGMALPGKWFTEPPKDETVYLHWFKMISEMNSNTIRVYTLMDPSFYHALLTYNQHSEKPLWLLQEVWPEENQKNYLEETYNAAFQKEMEKVVDAIHGKAHIPERKGRAFGQYTSDVSPYVLGYLVGRELEPDEVLETNNLNQGFVYKGDYVAALKGSPTENWLAWSCDYLLSYEVQAYKWQHPVAIVSWPTLDSLQHDSEWNKEGDKSKISDDKATIDIRNFELGPKMKSGLFGAYHIYPNYPDFMNNEVAYDRYQDEEGRLRYGAYLQDFTGVHPGFPAIVAEYGLATGMGNAHHNPDGLHHGGLTEEEQGKGIVRMTKAIYKEGYAGALIFEWMDEWAKKTWTTEPFMIPYENHNFWHNMIDPEQNYGILAMETTAPNHYDYTVDGSNYIKKVNMQADPSYLYISVKTKIPFNWSKDELLVGLDTYDRNRGEFKYRSDLPIESQTGMEYLLEFKGQQSAKLLVNPSYNIGGNSYSSVTSKTGTFEEIRRLTNKQGIRKDGSMYDAYYENGSMLNYGSLKGFNNHWNIEGNTLTMRIPWGRLNVTDPTTYKVLDDPRKISNFELERDELMTKETDGIQLSIVWLKKGKGEIVELFPGGHTFTSVEPYKWKPFGQPIYRERLKGSYYDIKECFQTLGE